MSYAHCKIATVTFNSDPLSPNPNFKSLIPLHLSQIHIKNALNPYPHLSLVNSPRFLKRTRRSNWSSRASLRNSGGGGGEVWKNWVSQLPTGAFAADKILRLISGATSSPIYQFISLPTTFLHYVDPRIKLVWLLALVVLPSRSHILMRFALVAYTALLSIWILPKHVWMDQLGRVSLLSGILFLMLGLGSDSVPPLVQMRTPPLAITGLVNPPLSLRGYSYLIMKLGPLQFTRKGLSVASIASCLTFIIFQSASLCLATTTPEQLAFSLQWFMTPLRYFGAPVAEIILTLLLSLRFISLVFDEVRNVALGVVSHRINWQELTVMETMEIFASYIRRIFKNIFSHAEKISQAMIVRGFRGDSSTHKIYFLSDSSAWMANIISLVCLAGVMGGAFFSDYFLV